MPLNHSKYSNLTDDQFKLIGKIIVEFSNIEFLLGLLLGRIIQSPFALSRTFTEKLSSHNLISSIKDALTMHEHRLNNKVIDKNLSEQILFILSLVVGMKTERNKFAHHLWARSDDSSIIGTKYSSKQLSWQDSSKHTSETTVTELEASYKKIFGLVESIQDIIEKIPETKTQVPNF